MVLALYLATASLVLWLVHQFVRPVSRAAALVLVVVPLGVTGYAVVTGQVYGPVDHLYRYEPLAALAPEFGISGARNASAVDIWTEFFPWRLELKNSLARGEWPLWKAANLAGVPFAANAQSAPYSPFTWVALLLPATVSMTFTAAMALFVAALSAYLFARELELGEGAALFAAAGWGLASSIVLYNLTAMGFTTAYAPLLLAATRRVIRTPGVHAGALLMIVLALQVVAGHPESLFLNVLVGGFYALFELVRARRNPLPAIGTAVAAGLVALCLCAIFLLPLLEAIPQSVEYLIKAKGLADVKHGQAGTRVLASLATNVFPHLHVRLWESPKLGYVGAETAAVGSLILGFALFAVWSRRSAETWFFAALGLFCILTGARWAPIADTLHRLPLFNITLHDRLAFHGALCLVILAAIGIEYLRPRAAAMTLGALFVVLAIGTWWLETNVVTKADYGRYRILAELVFLAAAALYLAVKRSVAIPVLLALLVGQRVLSELDTFGTYPREAAYPPVKLFEPLKDVKEPFRLTGVGLALPPEINIFYDVEDVRGYEALTLEQFARTWPLWSQRHGIWFNRIDDLTKPILSLMNVRFAIQSASLPVPKGWQVINRDANSVLLENPAALPRIFVPQKVMLVAASAEEIVDRMSVVRDFRTLAFITSREGPAEHENGPGVITLKSRSAGGFYEFDADMQRAGFVVVTDASWRGWQAFVDGKRVPLHRANAAFLGIRIPAGRHAVWLRYWPQSFVRGRAVTGVTLAILILIATLHRSRPKRPATE